MNTEKFSDAMGEIDSKYVEEALRYRKKRRIGLAKWGAAAVGLAAAVILGVGLLRSGLPGNDTDVATLENGEEIVFVKSDAAGFISSDQCFAVTVRPLTEEETRFLSLLAGASVTGDAIYTDSGMGAGGGQELIGMEGKIGNVKFLISLSDRQLRDTVLVGTERSVEINGTAVTAGYFVSDPNSRGGRNVIYYASFELGSSRVYLENAGTIGNREAIKNELAKLIQKLTENGELDFADFDQSGAGTGLDGDPDGYGPLPEVSSPGEEASEQDTAAD